MLPAVGAGLYALLKSEFFTRQAKDLVDEAKTRAFELPNDLLNTVHPDIAAIISEHQRRPAAPPAIAEVSKPRRRPTRPQDEHGA